MMNLQHVDVIAPFASPLPPLPEGDVLTPSQWTTLMAIGDAVIPSLVPSSSNSVDRMSIQASEYVSTIGQIRSTAAKTATEDNIRAFLDESASSIPDLKALIHRILSEFVPDDARKGIRGILSALKHVSNSASTYYVADYIIAPVRAVS